MDLRERQRREASEKAAQQYFRSQADLDDTADDPERQRPARPSEYGIRQLIDALAALKREGIVEVYLYCRCSDKHQNLARQVKGARRMIERLGIKVRHVYHEFVNGKLLDSAKRPKLRKAFAAARKLEIPLVVAGFTRIVRADEFEPSHKMGEDARPTVAKVEKLMEWMEGVMLLSLNDPDADPVSDEEFIKQLHALVKRRKRGRRRKRKAGDLKRRKREWKKCVLKMYARLKKRGMGYRLVAEEMFHKHEVEISHQTVKRWVEEG
jgi:hypothetical protein